VLKINRTEIEFGENNCIIETGKVAKQAGGAVMVRYGDTEVLVTATASEEPREDIDFTPLLVDYEERFYAAGKIPGGFIKREGRPRSDAILNGRLIDRSIRPLFPEFYRNDIQVVTTVLSVDEKNTPEVLGLLGASLALGISEIPFEGPIGACRIGLLDKDNFIINPSLEQLVSSRLDMVIAGSEEGITMIEAGAKEVSEADISQALRIGYEFILKTIQTQKAIISQWGKTKKEFEIPAYFSEIEDWIRNNYHLKIADKIAVFDKSERQKTINLLYKQAVEEATPTFENLQGFALLWEKIVKENIQDLLFKSGLRQDGRRPNEIRPIECEVGILPRTHGSALFTRGQTQAMAITTLGATSEGQKVDGLQDEEARRFMLHYNFPPFSTGEVRPMRGPGRREIGHGALAERALEYFIPPESEFPYAIRIVSEILESNGSSSMATVCGGSLSLMDAGVPIRSACAGLSIGLMRNQETNILLRDILGSEDHYGEMDFKVAGSRQGITAIQLDVKNRGLSWELLSQALEEAKSGRNHILEIMDQAIHAPREILSPYAPKIGIIEINPDRIGSVIGPGGKIIKKIVDETGAIIDIQDDGKIIIFSRNEEGKVKAVEMIKNITQEVEIGKTYLGRVTKTTDFGAFVEIFPGREGLVHISQLARERVRKTEDVVKTGDDILVKVIGIDSFGKVSLSHKDTLSDSPVPSKDIQRSREKPRFHSKRDKD